MLNPSEIFLVWRIFAEMDITLKLWIMVVMNTFSLLQSFLGGKNICGKSFPLIHLGYIKQSLDPLSHMLSWTRSFVTQKLLWFGMNVLVIRDYLWCIVSSTILLGIPWRTRRFRCPMITIVLLLTRQLIIKPSFTKVE